MEKSIEHITDSYYVFQYNTGNLNVKQTSDSRKKPVIVTSEL